MMAAKGTKEALCSKQCLQGTLHCYCEVLPHDVAQLPPDVGGVVLSGGPHSVYGESAPHASVWPSTHAARAKDAPAAADL